MGRVMADCRQFPSESNCSLVIIGEEDEVVRAGSEHAISVHKHDDTTGLRDEIRSVLEPEGEYATNRTPQPLTT